VATVPLQANNRIWLTYRHFPYKAANAVAELVDNSSQSYLDHRDQLDPLLQAAGQPFAVRIDSSRDMFSVVDNAMGMDLDDLRRAVQLAAPPPDTSGRGEFGMGMKTSCCWLGDRWSVITKKLGSDIEYTVTIDVEEIAKSDSHELEVREKRVKDRDAHYTRIEVTQLHDRLKGRALGAARANLVDMFRHDVESGTMELLWDGAPMHPTEVEPLETTEGDVTRVWKKSIAFDVEGLPVRGWICILQNGGRGRAGFDLFRRGRVILGRPLGYRPYTIFGEARNDLINQRIYGQLEMNEFPVNHLKDDFLWNGLEDEFQEKLKRECVDYVDFARKYRPRGQKVPTALVHVVNDAIADDLSDEEMLESIEIVEVLPVPDELDPAVREAKAELLRAQQIEPRIVEVGRFQYRIFHPVSMPESDPYFFRQSAEENKIDIFINDNHPFIAAQAEDEAAYPVAVRMTIADAIVEHALVHKDGPYTPSFPARLKDQLLRTFGV
jgi:hypothetical protein